MEWHYLWLLHLLFYIFVLFLYVDTFLDNHSTTKSLRLWVGFSGRKNVPSSCTHLGPAQVMEVIIVDV